MSRGTTPTNQAGLPEVRVEKNEVISLEVPADYKYLDAVTNLVSLVIDRMGTPPDDPNSKFAITLAIHEACTNIIEHAYHGQPGKVQVLIELDISRKNVQIEFSDQGDPASIERIEKTEPHFPQVKGYGLFLIRQLVDQVQYSREGDTNRWKITKHL
jgi:serine/threonine-protein kinase RsbW